MSPARTQGRRSARVGAILALLLTGAGMAAQGGQVTRERLLPRLVARADGTWSRLHRQEPSYDSRQLFTAMLAYCEAGTNTTRLAKLLETTELMQSHSRALRGGA